MYALAALDVRAWFDSLDQTQKFCVVGIVMAVAMLVNNNLSTIIEKIKNIKIKLPIPLPKPVDVTPVMPADRTAVLKEIRHEVSEMVEAKARTDALALCDSFDDLVSKLSGKK